MQSLDIIIQIRKIVRSINLESKRIQKDFGISIPQLLCMEKLKSSTSYQSTHGELMKFLSLNSSTISGIINRLETKGLVARLPNMEDRRITYISLTTKGLRLLETTPNVLHDKLAKFLDELDPEKRVKINEALDMIISSMQIEDVDASPLLIAGEPLSEN